MSWAESLIGAGVGAAAGIWSASQANRFAERMSSTAHQREVKDLRAAGLNPMLSANRGASSPGGATPDVAGGAQRGVSSALAIQQQRASIELTKAQTDAATAAAGYTRVQRDDLTTQGVSGRYQKIRSDADQSQLAADLARRTLEERADLVSQALAKAKEEIKLTSNSAAQAAARTDLLRLMKEGHENVADFEKRIGEAGPAVKFFYNLVRAARSITP